ncbi:MAG TPA: hypothetical protein VHX65_20005 [Pirellulales bacterium]|jgi:hypothetical protein|nr:hypothetical protein [Pirellulales bacterium]
MRLPSILNTPALFAATLLLTVAAAANADEAPTKAKQMPTDDTIIKLCGDSLANMFAKCGVPEEITVNGDNLAVLIYGPYAFTVKGKKVIGSFFFDDWKGTIKGVKYGDTKDQSVKVLGKGYSDVNGKGSDGKPFEAYGWNDKSQKATFWLYFTDGKVSNVQVTRDD